ncbi:hypothetical protein [Necropsobacter massiliensis]|uniref:hypothetical protein n=1 Tax=Necropsobacter massiliensis TaxID=1400001 RepID=UPI00066004BA|nr:hypothetical protein [Necropsobacter massiliensis]
MAPSAVALSELATVDEPIEVVLVADAFEDCPKPSALLPLAVAFQPIATDVSPDAFVCAPIAIAPEPVAVAAVAALYTPVPDKPPIAKD